MRVCSVFCLGLPVPPLARGFRSVTAWFMTLTPVIVCVSGFLFPLRAWSHGKVYLHFFALSVAIFPSLLAKGLGTLAVPLRQQCTGPNFRSEFAQQEQLRHPSSVTPPALSRVADVRGKSTTPVHRPRSPS